MIRIQNIKLPITYGIRDLRKACEKALRRKDLPDIRILRRSIDARKKDQIHYHISAGIFGYSAEEESRIVKTVNNNDVMLTKEKDYTFPYPIRPEKSHEEGPEQTKTPEADEEERPVIIGTGPAGYFAGLLLARAGFRPILLERGKAVEERKQDVDRFWDGGPLNTESNVSFGEGGAGTFSDGKLYTGNKDKDGSQAFVLRTFHEFGAGEEICYEAKPHIGTDVLYRIMQNMRKEIRECGGEILFSHLVTGIEASSFLNQGYKLTVKSLCKQEEEITIETPAVILAIGHSARDTFRVLYDLGLSMEQKPFALGLRVEHPRTLIDRARYGEAGEKGLLPAADYKLTFHSSEGRAVFSFCMCPGGYVVNASTEEGGTVVNGMSYSGRDGKNSNSAIVVNILPEDYPGEHPLDGVRFQREIEQAFFRLGEGQIPVQCYGDFRDGRPTEQLGSVTPEIKGSYHLSNLREGLPEGVSRAIIEAMPRFAGEIPGFDLPDAVMSGVESRTSSPVRILRGEDLQAEHFPGIFPCGEGAGYAGGITSAAVDGIHVAEAVAAYLTARRTKTDPS